MRRSLFILWMGLSAASLLLSCGKRTPQPAEDEAVREKELDLFLSAIQTVQDRYVDVDRVQLEQLMSNSLRGMVEMIDPFAQIEYASIHPTEPLPSDAPMVELSDPDPNGIAVLRIHGFNSAMKKQLRRLESVINHKQPAGILIDGRSSFGDDYTAATAVAEWFLPKDSIVGTIIEKQGESKQVLSTRQHPLCKSNRVVILSDRQLSGPAEMLATALRFHERGLLAGEPSRGMAVIQSTVRLTDEWNVRLSTGRVLDPDGQDITGRPLTPDEAAQPEPAEGENVDWIYNRGITLLRNQLRPKPDEASHPLSR